MAQRLTPTEPGADQLDDGISRLRAMKTTVGLVLARALEAAHQRFLVLGSTLAILASKVEDLEQRDNISWEALDFRLQDIDARATTAYNGYTALQERVAGIRTPIEQAAALQALTQRVEQLEADRRISAGLHDHRTTLTLLRAALDVLDPPVRSRGIGIRGNTIT